MKRQKEEKKFDTNRFYYYANEYMKRPTTNEELQAIDMTQEFMKEIEEEVIHDELVDINVNGKVRMGKSTFAIDLGRWIYGLLIKHKKRMGGKYGIKNVARDQQEYSRIMRDKDTKFTVIVTDEINELEETGENVTVEKALSNVFSNIQAGRYVHRVSCSPKDVTDPNADVFLEVISVNKKEKMTHCHLYYRMFKGGVENMQLLGYVNWYVGELIDVWDKQVRKHFFKEERTEYDNKEIAKWRKKDFYTEYMIKKYEKMDLITKEGIMRPRLLDYAEIILGVEERLRSLARLNVLNRNTIKNFVKMYCRKAKIPTSIVGEELMTQEVDGILSLWKSYFRLMKDLQMVDKMRISGKIDSFVCDEKEKAIKGSADDLMETIQAQLEELRRYKEINSKYSEVVSHDNCS